jgi:hypothetical protein
MAEKKKYPFEGKQVEGESIPFHIPQGEKWTEYDLTDGSKVRAKIVMSDIVRLDKLDENGNHIYLFNAQQVVSISHNPSLKKKVS